MSRATINRDALADAARAARAAGLSVVPPREDGTKRPSGAWKQYQTRSATVEEFDRWYAPGRNGLGIVTGRVSGNLELLEFEGRAVETGVWGSYREAAARTGLEDVLDRVRAGYCETTPSGGLHFLVRCSEIEGNQKLAARVVDTGSEVLIETRGEGGYVVVAPSRGPVHPSERPWVLLSGGFDSIAEITPSERRGLLDLARTFDGVTANRARTEVQRASTTREAGRPGDDYNTRAAWAQILKPRGWELVHVDGDGRQHWRRPGKTIGTSATVTPDGEVLYVFSTSAAPLEAERAYDKFGAYAALEHGGDHRAAASALRTGGFAEVSVAVAAGSAGRRPVINVAARAPRDIADYAWELLGAANEPPRLFVSGGPVRVDLDDHERPLVQPLTVDRVIYELSYVADWIRPTKSGDRPVGPPHDVAKQMLATPSMPLPVLERVVEAPVFARDGSLQTDPGYHAASRTLYVPAPGFCIPSVSDRPTTGELQRAKREIDELLHDFPFADAASRAHAVALLLLPFVRDQIDSPTPLHLFDKPVPGSGATLLAQVLLIPALGHTPALGTEANTDEEWRKRITSALSESPTAVVLDNLTGELRSPALMAAITSPVWEDRILGRNEIGRFAVRCAWVATANNLTLKRDLVRRTIYCRLDPKTDRPEARTGFRHELPSYAFERRAELVWAALTIVRAWQAAGAPAGSAPPLGTFEAWTRVIGGLLDILEIPGFLTDRDALRADADAEQEPELWLLEEWWAHWNTKPIRARDLFGHIQYNFDAPVGLLNGATDEQRNNSLAVRLRNIKDRVYELDGGTRVQVTKGKTNRGLQTWYLKELE